MNMVRWGLLSTANINRRVIPAIRMSARGDLAAVASRDIQKARSYASQWDIPKAFGSYEEMLASGDVDAVYISLPNHLHAEWSIKALEAGVHVLCEKPFSVTLEETDRMIAASKATGKVLAEAFMYRHHPQTKMIGEWVRRGRLGEVIAVRGTFLYKMTNRETNVRLFPSEQGGGSMWDVGVYPMSMAQYVFGRPPEAVFARQWIGPSGVVESFAGLMWYPGGGTAQISAGFRSPYYTYVDIIGTEGNLVLTRPFTDLEKGEITFIPVEGEPQVLTIPRRDLYLGEIEDLQAAILDGTRNYVTLEETRNHMRTALALYESARRGEPVSLEQTAGMRPLEILIAILLALRLAGAVIPSQYRRRALHWLSLAAVALIPIHMLVEGYRWQMIPLYLLALLLAIVSAAVLLQPTSPLDDRRPKTRWIGWGVAVFAFLLAVMLPVVLPVLRLPQPGGPYPVGTQTFVLTDPERKEIFSDDPAEPRRILYQVWYPAAPRAGDPKAPWMPQAEIVAPAIARELGLPGFLAGHLALSETNAFRDAPGLGRGEKFPVLVFSHGWTGFRAQNTHQMEELASHGYVVIGMEHPYGTPLTVFPDGEIVENNPEAISDANANRLVRQWAGDIALVLDSLTPLNSELGQASLAGVPLDLERIGVFGHSTGAGAGVEFCGSDARCQAYLGMDPYLLPVSDDIIYSRGLDQPALILYSQLWRYAAADSRFDALRTRLHGEHYTFVLTGAAHNDFTDLPLFSPLAAQVGLKGPIPTRRAIEIIDAYSLAFFDQYLKGRPSDLLNASQPPFPEVKPR